MSESKMKISIVVPAFNEEDCLEELIKRVLTVLDELSLDKEIIIVDDGSKDETWNVVKVFKREHKDIIKGIQFTRNFGKESAIYAGLKISTGDLIVVIDADLQHPPELIKDMYKIWKSEKVPIVEAVKVKTETENFLRKFFRSLFLRITSHLIDIKDFSILTDFKLMERKVVEAYLNMPERIRCFRLAIRWLGFDVRKITFIPQATRRSSRWSFSSLVSFALNNVIFSYTDIPAKLILFTTFFLFIMSLALFLVTILLKFKEMRATTIILIAVVFQFFSFVMLFILLVILSMYVIQSHSEIKNRPLFVEKERLY